MRNEELKEKIQKEAEQGNVVMATSEGLVIAKLDDLIKQPTEGLLYDLNRLPEVIFTFLGDPKWINDYAVALVIAKLKEKIAALENKEGVALHHATAQACQPETYPASTH